MLVSEVMTTNPITRTSKTTVREVMMAMREADIRHLPIVDAGVLVGMVSNRDLRHLTPPGLADVGDPHDVQRTLDRSIGDAMNWHVITVHSKDELTKAVDLMIEHGIGAVPVVESNSLELVGIVSYVDVLRAARHFV